MFLRIILWLSLTLPLLVGGPATAQVLTPTKLSTTVSPATAKVGDEVELIVNARIDPTWHLYATDFDPDLGPTVFTFTWTNNTAAFDGDLSQYGAVLFLNTPGEELNPAQRGKFEAYMRAGGNAMVVHRAAITPPDAWPWYEKLVGRRFVNHPMVQTGVVDTVDSGFPATFGLPERWIWSDEFYVTTNPYEVRIDTVLGVDESSYDPTLIWPGQTVKGMGKDHPIAWRHRHENGRVFVTTLGHNGEMYRDPQYLGHLLGGIYWAATGRGQRR